MEFSHTPVQIDYIWLAIIGGVCSIVGIIGDLSASIIKRQTGIKDFGNIMPGHGGIIDRFDSVLFVAPVFNSILELVQIVKPL
jgi:phosphatidate cytidylyltransferase